MATRERSLSKDSRGSYEGRPRTWDPIVGEEEKSRRKTLREESLGREVDEPVAIVTKKEIVSSVLPASQVPKTLSPQVVKKSANQRSTRVDYEDAKRQSKRLNDPKRVPTVYSGDRPNFRITGEEELAEERLTKVTGQEYLPPGFMELEPMLLVDEFEFVNRYYQEAFVEDQRKTKELRRKQYANRNMSRVRDFVVYRIDYLKTEALKILKRWFSTRDNPMPPEVISEFAELLGIEDRTFQMLHDAYLEELRGKARLEDQKKLNEAIFMDENQEELRNQDMSDEKVRDKNWEAQKRSEMIERQKKLRIEEARKRHQTMAEQVEKTSELEQNLMRAQREAETKSRQSELLRSQKEAADARAEKMKEEKKAREAEMLKARRQASKEKILREKVTGEKKEMMSEIEQLREEIRRLELDRERRDREDKEKKREFKAIKIDRSKEKEWRERAIRAEVEKEEMERRVQELEREVKELLERLSMEDRDREERLRREREELDRERIRLAKEREDEEERLKAERLEALEKARRQAREEAERRRIEEEREKRERLRREEAERLQAERDREQRDNSDREWMQAELEKIKREREKLEAERLRWQAEKAREDRKRAEDEKARERKRLEAARKKEEERKRKAKEEAERISFNENKKATKPWPRGLKEKLSAEKDRGQGRSYVEYEEDDEEEQITLATLDYDVRNPQYQERGQEEHQNMIEAALKRSGVPKDMDSQTLWNMFLDYCREELPGSAVFDKNVLADTFDRFMDEKFGH